MFTLLVALRMHYIPAQIISYPRDAEQLHLQFPLDVSGQAGFRGARLRFVAVNLVPRGFIGIQAVLTIISDCGNLSKLIALPFSIAVNLSEQVICV